MDEINWSAVGGWCLTQLGDITFCIITSFVFVFLLLFLLSPKVQISEHISKQIINGDEVYIFKVINKSWFNAYNVKFNLSRRIPYIHEGKVNYILETIPLRKSEVFTISKYKRKEGYGDFAALIGTTEDLSNDIGINNTEYELSVSMAHGLSNLTKVTKQRFKRSNVIMDEPFEFGKSLKISS